MHMKIVLFIGLLICGGCTNPGLTFHVIEATTGQPLAGVTAAEQGANHDMIFASSSHDVYGPIDETGVFTTGRMRRDWGYHWNFTKPGYKASHVLFSAGGSYVFAPLESAQNQLDPAGQHVPNHPFIVIPMYREERHDPETK